MSGKTKKQLFIWTLTVLMVLCSFWILQPFFLSLALGFIFAAALTPLFQFFIRRLGCNAVVAGLAVAAINFLFILIPLTFVITDLIIFAKNHPQLSDEFLKIQEQVTLKILQIQDHFSFLPAFNPTPLIANTIVAWQILAIDFSKEFMASLPQVLIQFAVMMIALFVVLIHYESAIYRILKAPGLSPQCIHRISRILITTSKDVVLANIVAGLIQASIVAIGVWLLSDLNPGFIFAVTFVLSFIPLLGTIPIFLIVTAYLIWQGTYTSAILFVAVSAVVGISDNITRAHLMSATSESNTFLNLLSCLGGVYIWGLPGLFLGPLIVSLSLKVIPILLDQLGNSNFETHKKMANVATKYHWQKSGSLKN